MRTTPILLIALGAQAAQNPAAMNYAKGVCRIHTREWMAPKYLGIELSVFDGENQQQIKQHTQQNYGVWVRLDKDKMPFGYDINVQLDFTYDDYWKNVGIWVGDITNMDFANYLDRTKTPYCEVGRWDWGNYWTWGSKIPVSTTVWIKERLC
jgi:hypothetical protein